MFCHTLTSRATRSVFRDRFAKPWPIEAAREAHALETGVVVGSGANASVESETVAVIAAALAVLLGRPYKLVAVNPLAVPAPHLNVWALEGRTQIFISHKVR